MPDESDPLAEAGLLAARLLAALAEAGEAQRRAAAEAARLAGENARLMAAITDVHGQRGDDLCWMDTDRIFAAAGLPVPDRRVGDKNAMLANCARYVETMCAGGGWRSYAELEADNERLRAALRRVVERGCEPGPAGLSYSAAAEARKALEGG